MRGHHFRTETRLTLRAPAREFDSFHFGRTVHASIVALQILKFYDYRFYVLLHRWELIVILSLTENMVC